MGNIEKLSSSLNCTVGIGILSWKSHKTLEKVYKVMRKLD